MEKAAILILTILLLGTPLASAEEEIEGGETKELNEGWNNVNEGDTFELEAPYLERDQTDDARLEGNKAELEVLEISRNGNIEVEFSVLEDSVTREIGQGEVIAATDDLMVELEEYNQVYSGNGHISNCGPIVKRTGELDSNADTNVYYSEKSKTVVSGKPTKQEAMENMNDCLRDRAKATERDLEDGKIIYMTDGEYSIGETDFEVNDLGTMRYSLNGDRISADNKLRLDGDFYADVERKSLPYSGHTSYVLQMTITEDMDFELETPIQLEDVHRDAPEAHQIPGEQDTYYINYEGQESNNFGFLTNSLIIGEEEFTTHCAAGQDDITGETVELGDEFTVIVADFSCVDVVGATMDRMNNLDLLVVNQDGADQYKDIGKSITEDFHPFRGDSGEIVGDGVTVSRLADYTFEDNGHHIFDLDLLETDESAGKAKISFEAENSDNLVDQVAERETKYEIWIEEAEYVQIPEQSHRSLIDDHSAETYNMFLDDVSENKASLRFEESSDDPEEKFTTAQNLWNHENSLSDLEDQHGAAYEENIITAETDQDNVYIHIQFEKNEDILSDLDVKLRTEYYDRSGSGVSPGPVVTENEGSGTIEEVYDSDLVLEKGPRSTDDGDRAVLDKRIYVEDDAGHKFNLDSSREEIFLDIVDEISADPEEFEEYDRDEETDERIESEESDEADEESDEAHDSEEDREGVYSDISLDLSDAAVEVGESVKVDVLVTTEVADEGFEVVFDGPETFSEGFNREQVSTEFSPDTPGNYEVKLKPGGSWFDQIAEVLLGEDILASKELTVTPPDTEKWRSFCRSEDYNIESFKPKIDCIEEEIVPKYFEDTVGDNPEVAESLCQDLLGLSYIEAENICQQ